jgi:hypothetical protein
VQLDILEISDADFSPLREAPTAAGNRTATLVTMTQL